MEGLACAPVCSSMSCDCETRCALQASTAGGWQPGLQPKVPGRERHTRRTAEGALG